MNSTQHRNQWAADAVQQRSPAAFALTELLVVVAIIGILAGLIATAVMKAQGKAQGLMCVNNARQLVHAWFLYASDSNERLPYNFGGAAARGIASKSDYNWVNNIMTWRTDEGNTNLNFISKGSFSPYAGGAFRIYRCPSDHALSEAQRNAGWSGRVRSYSMNAMVGDAGENSKWGTNIFNPEYRQFKRMSDFENPSGIFVFVDEHPDSINDGYFLNQADAFEWMDLPASYHNGAASFAFADGHLDVHRWINAETRPASRPEATELPFSVPLDARADLEWVIRRTSVEK